MHKGQSCPMNCSLHSFFILSMSINICLPSLPSSPPFHFLKIYNQSSLLFCEFTLQPFFNLASFYIASIFCYVVEIFFRLLIQMNLRSEIKLELKIAIVNVSQKTREMSRECSLSSFFLIAVHFFLPNWIQVKYHIEAIIPSLLFPDLGASIYVQYDNCRYTYA